MRSILTYSGEIWVRKLHCTIKISFLFSNLILIFKLFFKDDDGDVVWEMGIVKFMDKKAVSIKWKLLEARLVTEEEKEMAIKCLDIYFKKKKLIFLELQKNAGSRCTHANFIQYGEMPWTCCW